MNQLTQIKYADNTTRSYTYDFRGNKLTETDPLGRVTKYVYDLGGQLRSATAAYGTPDAATISYIYDGNGRRLTETDPRGNTTTYTYDAAGRLISIKDPLGRLTQNGYDGRGRRTSITDAKNRTTTYTYDSRGRLLTTTTPDGRTVTRWYDGLGNLTAITDEENRSTTFGYDAANQLISATDALNHLTQYSYDPTGNRASQTDANGNQTTYAYDVLSRRTARTLPLGQTESFTYDAVGNRITRRDFNGKTTTYADDSVNRLFSRNPDASFGAAPVSFTYTATGRRATMTDASGVTTYTYTNRDRVAVKSTPQGALSYAYDAAGRVISTVSSNTNGTNVSYAYNAAGQLLTVSDNWTGGTTTYGHDATGQLSSVQYPNGVKHAYTYDVRDRATNLAVSGSSGTLANYAQTFSSSGRKASVSEFSARTLNYSYDSIYRLVTESISGDPVSANNGSLSYVLDAVGNRSSLGSTLAALPSQSFTYDADDRISGDTFDGNGNTLTSGGHSFQYEFEDRLTQFDNLVAMSYDGDGNRVTRTQGGTTTRYLIDERTPTGYPQVAEEVLNGVVIRAYAYGPMRISQRLQIVGTNYALSYYGYDAGGSVRQLFDPSGAVTDTYAYDAFGNTVSRAGSTFNQFQYRGEQFDSTLGMYYLRARYYRPQVGRFLTADKYEGAEVGACDCSDRNNRAPSVGTHHLFAYAAGDPVNLLDPTGQGNAWFSTLALRIIVAVTVTAIVAESIIRIWECIEAILEAASAEGPQLRRPDPLICREQPEEPEGPPEPMPPNPFR